MNQQSLESVDWSNIPTPEDDGACRHLADREMPSIKLSSSSGGLVNLGNLQGWSILYFYPMTGHPGRNLPTGWNSIPGARGCTPQSCAFRDHAEEFGGVGVRNLFGISTQETSEQLEVVERLHLPFKLLSDCDLKLAETMILPTMKVEGRVLIKRLTLVLENTVIRKVFYPVFPPDQNATDVLDWLNNRNAE